MADWHPIMAAVEGPTGVWRMVDPSGHEYGRIEIRRVGDGEVRYKALRRGDVLGWATTLREACMGVHRAELASRGPGGRSGAPEEWELEERRRRAQA